jgi:IS1 family transposase
MGGIDAAWKITLFGEADQTFERLLSELSGYVVEVERTDGRRLDAVLIDAHTFQPVDEDGNPIEKPTEIRRVQSVHVY